MFIYQYNKLSGMVLLWWSAQYSYVHWKKRFHTTHSHMHIITMSEMLLEKPGKGSRIYILSFVVLIFGLEPNHWLGKKMNNSPIYYIDKFQCFYLHMTWLLHQVNEGSLCNVLPNNANHEVVDSPIAITHHPLFFSSITHCYQIGPPKQFVYWKRNCVVDNQSNSKGIPLPIHKVKLSESFRLRENPNIYGGL